MQTLARHSDQETLLHHQAELVHPDCGGGGGNGEVEISI